MKRSLRNAEAGTLRVWSHLQEKCSLNFLKTVSVELPMFGRYVPHQNICPAFLANMVFGSLNDKKENQMPVKDRVNPECVSASD